MPSASRPIKPLPSRQTTRLLRSTRRPTAQTVQSLLDNAANHGGVSLHGPSGVRRFPAELVNRIVNIIADDDDQTTLITLMRVGKDWHSSAAVHLYARLELGGRFDPFKVIYGLDRALCWDLPWDQLGRATAQGKAWSLALERSTRKIISLSMVQSLTLYLLADWDPWGKWVAQQIALPGGLFSAVKSLRIKGGDHVQNMTIHFSTSPKHYISCTARKHSPDLQPSVPASSSSPPSQHGRNITRIVVDDWHATASIDRSVLPILCQTFSTCCVRLDACNTRWGKVRWEKVHRFVRSFGRSMPSGLHAVRVKIPERMYGIVGKPFTNMGAMLQGMLLPFSQRPARAENGRRVRGADEIVILEIVGLGDFEYSAVYDGETDYLSCDPEHYLALDSFMESWCAVNTKKIESSYIKFGDDNDGAENDAALGNDFMAPLIRFIPTSLPPCRSCKPQDQCPDGKTVVHWLGKERYDLGDTLYARKTFRR